MKTLVHCTIAALCSMTLVWPAPQQSAEARPAGGAVPAGTVRSMARVVLPDNISHYTFQVRVGSGQFDTIRIHRVVKETVPGQPVRTVNAVMLLPGQPNFFETVYMTPLISQAVPGDHSLAVFLAKNNVDVWGMDYRWALVPAETPDLSFMNHWGIAEDVQDAQTALAVARFMRLFSGQGDGPLLLLGFSWGGMIGYSVIGEETQWPASARNVKGYIALEGGTTLEKDSDRAYSCKLLSADQAALDSGTSSNDVGLFLKQLGDLAVSAPKDPSDLFPGMTNYQAALFSGTSNELTGIQFWHFVAGYLDGDGVPNDLRYTNSRAWLDLARNLPPHYPTRSDVEWDTLYCGKTASPVNRYLDQIAIPIFHVGGAGGFGKAVFGSSTLTRSKDVKTLLVQRLSDDKRQEDFAHADTVLANDAETAVWKPILDWVVAHR